MSRRRREAKKSATAASQRGHPLNNYPPEEGHSDRATRRQTFAARLFHPHNNSATHGAQHARMRWHARTFFFLNVLFGRML